MHKNSEEPIRRFAVKKVEIKRKNDGIVIEDKAVINRLVSVRKGEKGRRLDPDDIVDINGYFHFDLPCKLVWECRIESDTEGIVHLICYHAKENGWYDYDVTSILTDHFR